MGSPNARPLLSTTSSAPYCVKCAYLLPTYKYIFVVSGRSQRPNINYDETLSVVVKRAIICTILSLTMSHNWLIRKLEVKNVFWTTTFDRQSTCNNQLVLGTLYFLTMFVFYNDHYMAIGTKCMVSSCFRVRSTPQFYSQRM